MEDTIYSMDPMLFLFLLLVSIGIFLAAAYYLTQWVHQIEKRNRYMSAQLRVLAEIALANNVPTETVNTIMDHARVMQTHELSTHLEKQIPHEQKEKA